MGSNPFSWTWAMISSHLFFGSSASLSIDSSFSSSCCSLIASCKRFFALRPLPRRLPDILPRFVNHFVLVVNDQSESNSAPMQWITVIFKAEIKSKYSWAVSIRHLHARSCVAAKESPLWDNVPTYRHWDQFVNEYLINSNFSYITLFEHWRSTLKVLVFITKLSNNFCNKKNLIMGLYSRRITDNQWERNV